METLLYGNLHSILGHRHDRQEEKSKREKREFGAWRFFFLFLSNANHVSPLNSEQIAFQSGQRVLKYEPHPLASTAPW